MINAKNRMLIQSIQEAIRIGTMPATKRSREEQALYSTTIEQVVIRSDSLIDDLYGDRIEDINAIYDDPRVQSVLSGEFARAAEVLGNQYRDLTPPFDPADLREILQRIAILQLRLGAAIAQSQYAVSEIRRIKSSIIEDSLPLISGQYDRESNSELRRSAVAYLSEKHAGLSFAIGRASEVEFEYQSLRDLQKSLEGVVFAISRSITADPNLTS